MLRYTKDWWVPNPRHKCEDGQCPKATWVCWNSYVDLNFYNEGQDHGTVVIMSKEISKPNKQLPRKIAFDIFESVLSLRLRCVTFTSLLFFFVCYLTFFKLCTHVGIPTHNLAELQLNLKWTTVSNLRICFKNVEPTLYHLINKMYKGTAFCQTFFIIPYA